MSTSHVTPRNYGAPWLRDELILAFDLYCRIPFKKTKASNPEVISLAKLLDRSPAAVARKLGNFGSFDPELQKQQVTGLLHASKLRPPDIAASFQGIMLFWGSRMRQKPRMVFGNFFGVACVYRV